MPPLPSTEAIRVSLQVGDETEGYAGSRFFLSYSGGTPSTGDMTTLCEGVGTAWGAHLKAYQTDAGALATVTCEDLSDAEGAVATTSPAIVGTRSGSPLPAQCAATVGFFIRRKYRGGKPKIFLPIGATADQADGATWGDTFITDLTAAFGAFIVAVLATSGLGVTLQNHVSISYYDGYNTTTPPWRGPGYKYPPKLRASPVQDIVTGYLVADKIGSQRRRRNAG